MNWGMIPFHLKGEPDMIEVDDYVYVPGIRTQEIHLYIQDMTENEREIVKAGCLINFNRNRKAR